MSEFLGVVCQAIVEGEQAALASGVCRVAASEGELRWEPLYMAERIVEWKWSFQMSTGHTMEFRTTMGRIQQGAEGVAIAIDNTISPPPDGVPGGQGLVLSATHRLCAKKVDNEVRWHLQMEAPAGKYEWVLGDELGVAFLAALHLLGNL